MDTCGRNGTPMSAPLCRTVKVSGRRTSLALDPAFWSALEEVCGREGMTLGELCTAIDGRRGAATLTSSVRVFALSYFRSAMPAAEDPQPAGSDAGTWLRLYCALKAVG